MGLPELGNQSGMWSEFEILAALRGGTRGGFLWRFFRNLCPPEVVTGRSSPHEVSFLWDSWESVAGTADASMAEEP